MWDPGLIPHQCIPLAARHFTFWAPLMAQIIKNLPATPQSTRCTSFPLRAGWLEQVISQAAPLRRSPGWVSPYSAQDATLLPQTSPTTDLTSCSVRLTLAPEVSLKDTRHTLTLGPPLPLRGPRPCSRKHLLLPDTCLVRRWHKIQILRVARM